MPKSFNHWKNICKLHWKEIVTLSVALHWIVDLFIIAPLSIAIGWFARGYFG
jgi:hypothetical protein